LFAILQNLANTIDMFKHLFALAALSLGLVAGAPAQTAPYPSKPIRLIVPFPPGGGTDVLSRLIATRLGESTGWSIVADNRAGAGGTLGISEAVKAPPTGLELVMGQKDNLVVAPWLYKKLPYQPLRDLTPVAHVAFTPIILVTSSKSRFKTLGDVIAAAKAAPDMVTYGSPGYGTATHLAGEILNNAAKIKMRHVPYKGANPAMMDTLAGNIDVMLSSVPSVMGQIKSGGLRPLAVTSATRSTSLPDVPTVAELGHPGFDVSTWYGLFAPAQTPKEVVTRVNTEVNKLLATPAVRDAIHAQGAEPKAMSPEQLGTLLSTEYQAWKGIVERSGASLD
jgi:tripartite-type tricarboxylate transporter receptor subunit TctC